MILSLKITIFVIFFCLQFLSLVKLVSASWNLSSVNLQEDVLIWRIAIWRNRAFLAIPRRKNDIKKKRFTLVEATWPEMGSETTLPLLPFPNSYSQLGIDNCFYFLRCVVALDVDSRGRLWILDVPTEKRCPAKIIVYDLRRNDQELTRAELVDVPSKNLRALVVDSGCGSFDTRAYIGDAEDESIIIYSLGRRRWWKVKLVHGPDFPIVYSSDLSISRSLLYLTGYPSHDLFSIDLEKLRNDKESLTGNIQNATVFWHGKKLGSSSGLFCDEKDGLHYFLVTERASVRWDTRLELSAENHLVLLQTEKVPYITHYISDSEKNVWGLTNSWYPFRLKDSGNFSTKLEFRTVNVFKHNYYL